MRVPFGASHQARQELAHLDGIRPRGREALLRAAQLGRGDELHRLGDLLRGLDGADPPLDVAQCRHGPPAASGRLDPRDAMNSVLASLMPLASASRISSVSSFLLAISGMSAAYWRERNGYRNSSKLRTSSTGTSSSSPCVPAKMMATCRSTVSGAYCPCFRSSTMRWPRASCCWVDLSRSEPNWAKAASSRYWARSSRSLPATCLHGLDLGRAPTRETDSPTLTAGRTPEKKRSDSR